MFGNDNEIKIPHSQLGREGKDWRREGSERKVSGSVQKEKVSDSCDKLQKQNHLSIKLDFTIVLLPDSPLTVEISQHYRAA